MTEVCCSILESFISKRIILAQHRIYSSGTSISRTIYIYYDLKLELRLHLGKDLREDKG